MGRTINEHRVGDVVVIDRASWHRSRRPAEQFQIAAFETVSGEPWARLVPADGSQGFYRCPVEEIVP